MSPLHAAGSESGGPVPPPRAGRAPAWAAVSDRGRLRGNNEDAWGAWALDPDLAPLDAAPSAWPRHGVLFAVSDGMGGARAGEEASRFCVTSLAAELRARLEPGAPAGAMRAAILATHAALGARGRTNPEWNGMGATLSALWLQPDGGAVIGHVGDSRILSRRRGQWRRWTEDHTLGDGLVRRGSMTAEAAARFRFRGLLEQVMGGDGRAIEPQIATLDWTEDELYVLCSDGMHRPLAGEFEARLDEARLQPGLAEAAARLVEVANAAGGHDNITVVLARPPSAG